ncbi:hypothetical protein SAMN02787073_4960 [Chryseobacterium vrystaatense]|uniref:Uncharacterized protein n=1 Tax=Chryseobacterium vrystaatense TaxID=307480 RepID=A0A1M5N757_9FLAO|nr:hypothetical protein SAMN02787073_4960 [Chryseobacterium vrystaatense]
MKKIINFFNPTTTLVLFVIVVITYIIINYISQCADLSVKYIYIKRAKMFNLFCFLPSLAFFLGMSIYNFSISKSNNNKKDMKISLVPIFLLGLFHLFQFFY